MTTPKPPADDTAQQTAEQVRRGMLAKDWAMHALGMDVVAVGPGSASVQMAVREDMLNGHGTCHGGLIATLADAAFAYACNAYGELTVASGFAVDFVAPGRYGDLLRAQCHEVSGSGRTGVYDVEVCNQDGQRVAVFRGRSHTIKGRSSVPSVSA